MHLDDLAGVHDGNWQAIGIVLGKLTTDLIFASHQDDLLSEPSRGLHAPGHVHTWGAVASHGVEHDSHGSLLLMHRERPRITLAFYCEPGVVDKLGEGNYTMGAFIAPVVEFGIHGRLRTCARKGVLVRVQSGAPDTLSPRAWETSQALPCWNSVARDGLGCARRLAKGPVAASPPGGRSPHREHPSRRRASIFPAASARRSPRPRSCPRAKSAVCVCLVPTLP